MHGTITKTRTACTDRAAVMRAAWTMWRAGRAGCEAWDDGLAAELRSRHAYIAAATDEAERKRRIASVTGSYRQYVAGRRPAAPRFGDCLRAAWVEARRPVPAALTGLAAERMAAECLPFRMEGERLRRLAEIDRREARSH